MEEGLRRIEKALVAGDLEWGFMPCGQVCGLIHDIPSCEELIERIMHEVDEIILQLGTRLE